MHHYRIASARIFDVPNDTKHWTPVISLPLTCTGSIDCNHFLWIGTSVIGTSHPFQQGIKASTVQVIKWCKVALDWGRLSTKLVAFIPIVLCFHLEGYFVSVHVVDCPFRLLLKCWLVVLGYEREQGSRPQPTAFHSYCSSQPAVAKMGNPLIGHRIPPLVALFTEPWHAATVEAPYESSTVLLLYAWELVLPAQHASSTGNYACYVSLRCTTIVNTSTCCALLLHFASAAR